MEQRIQLTPKSWKEGFCLSCLPCLLVETEIGTIPLMNCTQFVIVAEDRDSFTDCFVLEGGRLLHYRCQVTKGLKDFLACKQAMTNKEQGEE